MSQIFINMHASIKKPVKIVDYCDFPLQNVNDIFDLNKKGDLTLYDPRRGFKSSPQFFCPHAFNFRATLLCVGDFSQKIV